MICKGRRIVMAMTSDHIDPELRLRLRAIANPVHAAVVRIRTPRVIPVHPRTAFTPVVLLSGDADVEKRFDALHIGDDFLLKPIRPRHLVAAVTSRARRARWMRRDMLGVGAN